MANEAVKVEGPYEIHDFTIVNESGVEQFTLMRLKDARAIWSSNSGESSEVFAGILATEKIASDGSTEVGCITKGDFKLTSVDSISAGALVSLSGANLIKNATSGEILTGDVVGKAWEDIASGSSGEVHVGVTI